MFPNVSGGHNGRKKYVYYRCPKRIAHGPDACTHRKQYRAEKVEAAAWNLVSGLLTDPTRLRAALAETIEQERQGLRSDPDRDGRIWLSKLFPSYAAIDRKRFPAPESLSNELDAAGFTDIRVVPLTERRIYDREPALRAIRGRFASSFALMGEEEYRAGLERAERELPMKVESVLELVIVTARR